MYNIGKLTPENDILLHWFRLFYEVNGLMACMNVIVPKSY